MVDGRERGIGVILELPYLIEHHVIWVQFIISVTVFVTATPTVLNVSK